MRIHAGRRQTAAELKQTPLLKAAYVGALLKEGVLCKDTAKQIIRITPPLTITREECEWGIERITKVLA